MPPRKKVVRTVRKTPTSKSKAKSQSESPLPDLSPPAPAPETPTPTPNPNPNPTIDATDTPISSETPTSEPSTTGAVAETPVAIPDAPPETAEPLQQAAASDAGSQGAVGAAPSESPAMAPAPEEPLETAGPTEPSEPSVKTTTKRIRKVVRKKIVKKLVPKVKKVDEVPKASDVLSPPVPAQETPVEKSEPEKLEQQQQEEEDKGNDQKDESKDVAMEEEEEEDKTNEAEAPGDEEARISERQRRRKTEIFIGGLDRDAKEEDIRKVFAKVGEIVEIRMMMEGQTGKNKGYAFLRYKESAQAKKAVTEFAKVEICGKLCGAATLEGNDTIFLGNIDKQWTKEDVTKLLQEIGIEKIDTVTVMADSSAAGSNRGFAFLELETNRDAQIAYKKLQKKDVFGKGRNVKVAWAEPLNDPDEEEMQKVKSVYVEGIPSSWDQAKVTESFKKFGMIERVVLSRDIPSAKRKDFAFVNYTTREAALSCIELFDKEEIIENGSKVNIKVSLAKPVRKVKQNKGGYKSSNYDKEKPTVQRQTNSSASLTKGMSSRGDHLTMGDKRSSTTHELLHVLREQATWKQGQIGYGRDPAGQDYGHSLSGGKRPFSSLGDETMYSDMRGYPHPRFGSSYPIASSSYGALPHGTAGSSLPYYQGPGVGYSTGNYHGAAEHSNNFQMRQGAPPYGNRPYPRY
ncbi:uncharacterized protein [Typha angustifolia]|uniref:uncharacterized protein n=1 Tax=Typha angustifolia TaxID=59011 RepID=UPI003C2D63EF